jgi:hypothetical protein
MNIKYNTFRIGRLALMATTVAFALNSCTPEEEAPVVETPGTPTPAIYDGFGALVAVKTVTTIEVGFGIPDQEVIFGMGVAAFFDGVDYATHIDGGTVTCEDTLLSRFTDGTYSTYSTTSATGIEFSGDANWDVTGAGEIPAFSHTADRGFPNVGAITSDETVVRADGYTLTLDGGISNADSIIWVVGGESFGATGPMNSRTFTAAELSALQVGTSIIQVAPYNIDSAMKSGKKFYFINEMVVTKTVTVE